ncbi:VTT domain-containing protein [Legionella bononiensis]|uniref:Bifunctional DedA family/phosphatase PAP2 family protein n=1 Tax=Legionella bononiensis TaxID=2793102 RepID=A0ABS1WFB1_9GAMM|nr:VTT domain-containing protein [Legionella bononiensis]MBL7479231.1 bifunctional DedA family/phosphatase PAP2 family protein [Legionella bononiensis]MBL7528042.1 bifunctional DedA family/phosphatase PAP2 family protein [Legionella bononiensis]MBL7563881.1 bifunctional DedA family/phosphatase PAP2 family protein [Legionella bononiensis]
MNLFADYVHPLTSWLQANPHWSLFITFIIALTESLAIIGSIVPGSVTMTAIGILAGSGIMRIDLTLIAATLGAVCGDSLSYFLGYFYSDQLLEVWPFKKYPNLLKYGKDFFSKHGGKSVLIGRFVGPLRSIIPVIAGIMHMKQWRFLIANVLSAIGWSFLYVMPGVLIGTAGHELSTEGATRLFLLILVILAGVWFASVFIKSAFLKINLFLKKNLHDFWLHSKNNSKLFRVFNAITPEEEKDHYSTAGLLLLTAFFLLFFLVLLILGMTTQWLQAIDIPIHLFTQSLHTSLLESVFIICAQLTSTLTLTGLFLVCCIWAFCHRNYKIIAYLSSVLFFSVVIIVLLSYVHNTPRPQGLLITMSGSSFPVTNLVLATALYGFILFYINNNHSLLTNTFRTIILIFLGLSGFAVIYLGDYWLTDVVAAYLLGIIVCLIHWIIYRKSNYIASRKGESVEKILTVLVTIIVFTAVSTNMNYKILVHNHAPYHKEYTLTESAWWNQLNPVLPLYRLNRIGHRISLLNLQYYGNLDLLVASLEQHGWKSHTESFFTKLLLRMNKSNETIKLPLLAQLFENKRPALLMTYQDNKSKLILELTLWESNYFINNFEHPIWIGTVHQNIHIKEKQKNNHNALNQLINPIPFILPALNQFTLRRIEVPHDMIRPSSYPTTPYILLIRNPSSSN